jgi:hypothetical protein
MVGKSVRQYFLESCNGVSKEGIAATEKDAERSLIEGVIKLSEQ